MSMTRFARQNSSGPAVLTPEAGRVHFGTPEQMFMYSYKSPTMPKRATLNDDEATHLAELFRALGDASRVKIVAAISERELSVGAIAEQVGLSESAASHHLRGLRILRLVRARKDGRQVYYALDDDHVAELFERGLEHIIHG
jgi:DNA-binding transcriptional ArsR family regulator